MRNKHCRRNTVSGLLSEVVTKHVALWLLSDRPLYPCGFLKPWALFCGPGRFLNCPSSQPHPWSHWLNLREGGKCKKAASLYIGWQEGEASFSASQSTAQVESRAGQEYVLLAQFGAASWSGKVLLGPGWALAHAMLPPFFQGYKRGVGEPVVLWCDRESTSVDTHVTNVLREQVILIQFLIKVLGREELVMKAGKWCLLLWT